MHLSVFLTHPRMQDGSSIPSELDPLLLIITRLGMNRYSDEAQAVTRICLAVIAMDEDLPESDLLTLGRDARGLISAFATRRTLGAYDQRELDVMDKRLRQYQEDVWAKAKQVPQ